MKKRIFHIAVSVALFCVLTVGYFALSNGAGKVFGISERAESSETVFTSGENFKCVGEPMEILMLPKEARAGDSVSVAFKGQANTEYDIKVYYQSGLSEDDAFVARKSDGKGRVGWDFTVSQSAKVGRLRIVIVGEDTHFMTEIKIVD